eukprot:8177494-Pyramimonas_sp.AAC.1
MVCESGETVRGRQEIADVFADFYSKLYSDLNCDAGSNNPEKDDTSTAATSVSPFSMLELQTALQQMKKGKAADSKGIVVE